MSFRHSSTLAFPVTLLSLALVLTSAAHAQNSNMVPVTESGATTALATEAAPVIASALPKVIRWSGTLADAAGRTVSIQFSIYENQARGSALWNEAQQVKVGTDGRYSVLLGATTAEGIPQALFPAGEPRWIAAKVATRLSGSAASELEESETPRSLLAAVPYALKSVDAETLAGRAASDYVTHEDLQSAVTGSVAAAASAQAITPQIAGTGTTNALAVWTNSTTLGSSAFYASGTKLGINTNAPSTTLDLHGTAALRGIVTLPTPATATAATAYNSPTLVFGASAYSSSLAAAANKSFAWQAVATGNNTASPSATLQLLFSTGTANPASTGLSIGANGQITFASGQKFPGAGTITGITATSPLTGTGTSGGLTLGLNLSALETSLNSVYARLTAANNFTSSASFAGPITGNSGSTMYAIQGNTSSGYGVQGYATGTSGVGAGGYSTGNGGIGIYGNATGNANGSNYPIGVYGHAIQGTAVLAVSEEPKAGFANIFARNLSTSSIYNEYKNGNLSASIWGDAASTGTSLVPTGIAGTADDGYGGVFENNSATWSTLYVYNTGSAGTGVTASAVGPSLAPPSHFSTLMAGNKEGTCGVGGNGDFSCTGQIKSLISTRAGERTLEAYSVQSSENWMEDFGSSSLSSGAVVVTIDPDFAETVSASNDYRIFLTPNGDSKGLYVTNKTATSFEVRESSGGATSVAFDYRIVARRRGLEKQRLTDVTEQYKSEMAAAKRPLNKATANTK